MKTCVVIALDEQTRDFLAVSLQALEMEAVLLTSLGELRDTLEKVPVCGILLELATAVRASAQDKQDTAEMLELYPFVKFRVLGAEVRIAADTLPGFVERCRQFDPRTIRRSARHVRYLAVYLSADDTFLDAEKVVTADVSAGGCFVYSVREWKRGNRVWLKFPGGDAVACGTVCSSRAWGNNQFLPGIGIQLDAPMTAGFE